MLRFGIVSDINENKAQVRVKLQDADNIESYWLSVLQAKTLKDKFYSLPDEEEHVACLMDENSEEGVVIGAVYSESDLSPVNSKKKFHVKFEDSTIIEYDKEVKKLTADVKGQIVLKATEKVIIEAPIIEEKGDITHTGDQVTSGTVSAEDNISSGKSHIHPTPTGNSGEPI